MSGALPGYATSGEFFADAFGSAFGLGSLELHRKARARADGGTQVDEVDVDHRGTVCCPSPPRADSGVTIFRRRRPLASIFEGTTGGTSMKGHRQRADIARG